LAIAADYSCLLILDLWPVFFKIKSLIQLCQSQNTLDYFSAFIAAGLTTLNGNISNNGRDKVVKK